MATEAPPFKSMPDPTVGPSVASRANKDKSARPGSRGSDTPRGLRTGVCDVGSPRTADSNGCETLRMAEARFKVLDVVEIGDAPEFVAQGLTGQRGVVTQVRAYVDGRIQYGLGAGDGEADGVGGLFDEAHLNPTGERSTAEVFQVPGPFKVREIVTVLPGCRVAQLANRTAVVDGSYVDPDEDGELSLGIWIEELAEVFVVKPRFLVATGQRLPIPPAARQTTSTQVDPSGGVLGTTAYVIVDEIDRYL